MLPQEKKMHYTLISPKVKLYKNDGTGRDTYISSNNAGFYREYRIINADLNKIAKPKIFHKGFGRLACEKAVNRYTCDGAGRDLYIFHGNCRNLATSYGGCNLQDILRRDDEEPSKEVDISTSKRNRMAISLNKSHGRVPSGVVQRLFYGKSKDRDERRLSPKVVFAKKRKLPPIQTEYNRRNPYSLFRKEKESPSKQRYPIMLTEPKLMNDLRVLAKYKPKIGP